MIDSAPLTVNVTTGSRLHFGLTRYRSGFPTRFGGAGVMIEKPFTELCVRTANRFCTSGCERIERFAILWARENGIDLPSCELSLVNGPPAHSGFGSGTQLAQAVATGLDSFITMASPSQESEPCEYARRVARCLDRGNRSMIGSYGFGAGGLVVDGSDQSGNSVLARQIAIPEDWRVVLVLHRDSHKKFGLQEQAAFDNIAVEQTDRSLQLERLIANDVIPAVESADFERFETAVHEYGKQSGEYYKDVQGGIYNGPVISDVVETLLKMNAKGIGQSSWGPVVFSWCKNQGDAESLLFDVVDRFGETAEVWITSVRNQPANISIMSNATH